MSANDSVSDLEYLVHSFVEVALKFKVKTNTDKTKSSTNTYKRQENKTKIVM